MYDNDQNYTVGRGRVSFGQFVSGSDTVKNGELYFGNTPEFTVTTDTSTLDHYSAESGFRDMDDRVLLEVTNGGTFTCDNIAAENLALFFLGEEDATIQTQTTGAQDLFTTAKRGRYYQLGASADFPNGARNVTSVIVGVADADVSISTGSGDISTIVGVSVVTATGNYEVDLTRGRIYIEPDSTAFAGDAQQMVVQYNISAQSRTLVISKSSIIYGQLRFESDNPKGFNRDYFFPKVALSPDGDYALKGDDWQVMSFSFTALKMANRQKVYIEVHTDTDTSSANARTVTLTLGAVTAVAGASVTVTATVRDSEGNVVADDPVTFTTVSGATLTAASGTTNSTGQAVTTVSRAAAGTATVTVTASDGTSTTSAAITFTA